MGYQHLALRELELAPGEELQEHHSLMDGEDDNIAERLRQHRGRQQLEQSEAEAEAEFDSEAAVDELDDYGMVGVSRRDLVYVSHLMPLIAVVVLQ